MEGSQDDGHKVGPGMGGSFGQGHRAVRSRPLILSPMLFQYHTASEPTLRTPLCSRFLSVPQSHSCGHSRTWGQTILSQPGAFEPSLPRPALFLLCSCFQSPSILGAGVVFIMSSSLLEFSTMVESAGCSEGPACMVLVCREPYHIVFLTGVLEPVDLSPYTVPLRHAQMPCQQARTRLRVRSERKPLASPPTCQ